VEQCAVMLRLRLSKRVDSQAESNEPTAGGGSE